ncbi:hypothetical protein OS493_002009 [Desmophyllum pertusum]|uniref:CxC1-like cysteine cluster associated with KDZ transposases domain-containing protein n=1 Tax=Desmophyllum pertusum TaxID=174260 RepID=A0A9W9Z588_9CNID|nr:hypothetical protein OS493_002009 [Desmophyllum pertusum]
MKRFKPVSVKNNCPWKRRKSVIHTPLAVNTNASRKEYTSTRANQPTSSSPPESADIIDDHDVPVFSPEAQHSEAYRRNLNSVLNWDKVRDQLLNANVEEEAMPASSLCSLCKEQEPSLRCQYCGPRQFFCSKCAHDLHAERNQFHIMELWKDNRFVPLFPNHGVIECGHCCCTRILKTFKLVDAFGNQHLKEVAVCECESHAVTLVRCQFWPGSPERPSVGFHFKLMDLAEKLFLHSQVSVKEFSELLLEMTPPLQPNFISSMYAILNSGCFEEYRISYSVYELKKLKESLPSNSLKVVLMYDIACILSRHLKNSSQEELLSDVDLAIPIFHCYGHKASCQVQFSPRRTSNIGLTDGEGVERFWSFLRQFSAITKEMSVDKRNDVLTDASLHYGEHLFHKFGPALLAKLRRASTLLSTVGEEIRKLIVSLPDGCDLDTVRQWIDIELSEIVPSENGVLAT